MQIKAKTIHACTQEHEYSVSEVFENRCMQVLACQLIENLDDIWLINNMEKVVTVFSDNFDWTQLYFASELELKFQKAHTHWFIGYKIQSSKQQSCFQPLPIMPCNCLNKASAGY